MHNLLYDIKTAFTIAKKIENGIKYCKSYFILLNILKNTMI